MPDPTPSTCEIRDWVVFGPGYWRGALYTPADCDRVPGNFEYLKGYINPVVKLGHDKKQVLARLKMSRGFLNLGDFKSVRLVQGSRFSVTLVNVPVEIGGLVNAGRIRSGSVELIPFCDDPKRPGKQVTGPIITGVALLGEEHPAVKGFSPPKAVFADGTPVPAATDLTPWFEAMASAAQMADEFSDLPPPMYRVHLNGRDYEYPLVAVSFSEFSEVRPMLDAAFLQSLGLTPEQVEAIMAKESGGGTDGGAAGTPGATDGAPPPPPPPPTPPTDAPGGDAPMPPPKDMAAPATGATGAIPGPVSTPTASKDMAQDDQTMMSAATFADFGKRLAAMEKKYSDATNSACMSAYTERVDRVLADNVKRVPPRDKADYRAEGLRALSTKTFGAVSGDAEKAFAKWKAFVESLPESDKFSEEVLDSPGGAPKKRNLSPFQLAVLNSRATRQQTPEMRQRVLTAAGYMKPSTN